MIIQMTRNNR